MKTTIYKTIFLVALFIQIANFESWAIWNQPLDGQEPKELISAEKLKPFFGANDLLLHYIGDETFQCNMVKKYTSWQLY